MHGTARVVACLTRRKRRTNLLAARGYSMKAGDLVTLSAYGNNLGALYKWSRDCRAYNYKKAPMVGLVVKVAFAPYYPGDQQRYVVRWIDENPPHGRNGHYGADYFNRKDLKFVKRVINESR